MKMNIKKLIKIIRMIELFLLLVLADFTIVGAYTFWQNGQTLLMLTTGAIFMIIFIGIYPAFISHKKK